MLLRTDSNRERKDAIFKSTSILKSTCSPISPAFGSQTDSCFDNPGERVDSLMSRFS